MSTVVVYTTISNGWDNLREPEIIEPGVHYICFTNTPQIATVKPWEFRPLYMPTGMFPARFSRLPKILPHLFFDADVSIYHDANFRLMHPPSILAKDLLREGDIALHRHPGRNCLYAEGECCIDGKIGDPHEIRAQLNRYMQREHPADWGLWACGFMARRHVVNVQNMCEFWWKEFAAGCARDQISFPVAARAYRDRVRINSLSTGIYSNEFVRFAWHAAWKTKEDNPNYFGRREEVKRKLDRLREIAGNDERVTYEI